MIRGYTFGLYVCMCLYVFCMLDLYRIYMDMQMSKCCPPAKDTSGGVVGMNRDEKVDEFNVGQHIVKKSS